MTELLQTIVLRCLPGAPAQPRHGPIPPGLALFWGVSEGPLDPAEGGPLPAAQLASQIKPYTVSQSLF